LLFITVFFLKGFVFDECGTNGFVRYQVRKVF